MVWCGVWGVVRGVVWGMVQGVGEPVMTVHGNNNMGVR